MSLDNHPSAELMDEFAEAAQEGHLLRQMHPSEANDLPICSCEQ